VVGLHCRSRTIDKPIHSRSYVATRHHTQPSCANCEWGVDRSEQPSTGKLETRLPCSPPPGWRSSHVLSPRCKNPRLGTGLLSGDVRVHGESWRVSGLHSDLVKWSRTAQSKRGIVPQLHGHDPPREGHLAINIGRRGSS
jgi:hypothetical protein